MRAFLEDADDEGAADLGSLAVKELGVFFKAEVLLSVLASMLRAWESGLTRTGDEYTSNDASESCFDSKLQMSFSAVLRVCWC